MARFESSLRDVQEVSGERRCPHRFSKRVQHEETRHSRQSPAAPLRNRDLRDALADALATELTDVDSFVIAMNDAGHRHIYPSRVRFEIADGDLESYRRAADFLNVNQVDVLSVQHEYGIFGGKAGAHLALLRELRMPS